MHTGEFNPALEKIKPEEYAEVVVVWEASVRATHHFLSEQDIQFLKPLVLNDYLSMVKLFGVRYLNGKIAGFLGVAGQS